ncbi:MAG: tRNA (adenosine(37)-N6)-dimethylallyltransferase MiaA [Thermodesulfobacteriota bacterium]|nr:tRNA (adenosine(37)-N6)-dimethylallyltransferase MiaA [Thermodesulfobacteriota bacterium]
MKREEYNLIVILGPTASGKTRIAARLARDLGSEVISADSRQVYRGMDLGTGKDVSEFMVDNVAVPCHLIDIVDTDHEFNLFEYQKMFYRCFSDISDRGIIPIMAGGTGLYLEAIIKDYHMLEVPEDSVLHASLQKMDMNAMRDRLFKINPTLHNTTDTQDRDRLVRAIEIAEYSRTHEPVEGVKHPPVNPFVIGIRWDRSVLRARITRRLKERIDAGMIEEVRNLHDQGTDWERLDSFGLEYRYVSRYLQGKVNFDEMFSKLNTRIHQFSKRQMTWFRRMERRGVVIHWTDNADDDHVRWLVEENIG